jgi:plasmid stabilization system protein ParE
MARQLVLFPLVNDDVQETLDWYFREEPGLDDRFLASLDEVLLIAVSHPESFPIYFARFRRALLDTFPYAVFYEFDDDQVRVYGVLHCSRSPSTMKRRLR